jgi:protease I
MTRPARIAVLAAQWVDEMEILYPIWRLKEEGIEIHLLTADGKAPTRGEHDLAIDWYLEKRQYHEKTLKVADADPGDYDGVICPGGYSQDHLRHLPEVQRFVQAMDREEKVIAWICHGVWTPVSAGVLKGRRVTCVAKIKDDAINAGAEWLDQEVVQDGHLISSRTPPDLGAFCRTIVAYVQSRRQAQAAE